MSSYYKEYAIKKWQNNWQEINDIASLEEEVIIHYSNKTYKILACPINLEELALGYILLEKIQKEISAPPSSAFSGAVKKINTNEFAVEVYKQTSTPAEELYSRNALEISKIMQNFMSIGGKWDDTGSFHRAAIVNLATKEIIHFTEDIGRHNCVDRLAGFAGLNNYDLRNYALFISSRITASLFLKARLAGFRFMVSRSAVSSYAVNKAREEGITLLAFTRDKEKRLSVFADTKGNIDYRPTPKPIKNALILAGGLSKRLGQDKTKLNLIGEDDMLLRTKKLLENICENVYISCRPENTTQEHKYICDSEKSEGPLVGILSALRELKEPFLVLSCDLPFMNIKSLEKLITEYKNSPSDKVLTCFKQDNTGYLEALVAIYKPEALAYFEQAYASGERQLNLVIPTELRHEIAYNKDEALSFFNINYPADLDLAMQLIKYFKL